MSYTKPVYPNQAFTLIRSCWVSLGLQRHSHTCGGRRRGESKSSGPVFAPGSRLLHASTKGEWPRGFGCSIPPSLHPSVSLYRPRYLALSGSHLVHAAVPSRLSPHVRRGVNSGRARARERGEGKKRRGRPEEGSNRFSLVSPFRPD